jgi:hypothetical protein
MLRTHIVPAIVALWGTAIVINGLVSGVDGSGAYAVGELGGGAIGVLMIVLGGRALLRARGM